MSLRRLVHNWMLIGVVALTLGLLSVAGVTVSRVYAGGNGSGQCQDDGEEADGAVEDPAKEAADDAAEAAAGCVDEDGD